MKKMLCSSFFFKLWKKFFVRIVGNDMLSEIWSFHSDHFEFVPINVKENCVRETNVAVAKQYYIFCVCVCILNYPARRAHASYYVTICGLFGLSVFSNIIS